MNRRFSTFAYLLAAAVVLCGASEAQESTGLLEVGSTSPNFELASLDGENHALAERTGEGPTVLVFFRGAW